MRPLLNSIMKYSKIYESYGPTTTGRGNVDGLQKCYACSTGFFSYTLLKDEILWNLYLLHKLFIQRHIFNFSYVFAAVKVLLPGWESTGPWI